MSRRVKRPCTLCNREDARCEVSWPRFRNKRQIICEVCWVKWASYAKFLEYWCNVLPVRQ